MDIGPSEAETFWTAFLRAFIISSVARQPLNLQVLPRIRLVFATRPYRQIIDDHSRGRSLATALCFASGLATPSYTITRDTTFFAGSGTITPLIF